MEEVGPRGQTHGLPPWATGLAYVLAPLAGVALVVSGQASAAEASGYVTPFLLVYERMSQRQTAVTDRGPEGGAA